MTWVGPLPGDIGHRNRNMNTHFIVCSKVNKKRNILALPIFVMIVSEYTFSYVTRTVERIIQFQKASIEMKYNKNTFVRVEELQLVNQLLAMPAWSRLRSTNLPRRSVRLLRCMDIYEEILYNIKLYCVLVCWHYLNSRGIGGLLFLKVHFNDEYIYIYYMKGFDKTTIALISINFPAFLGTME